MDNDKNDTGASYERKDIRFGWLAAVLVAVCCFAAIHYYTIWRLLWFREGVQESQVQSPYPMAPKLSAKLPPEPRLEQLDRLAGVDSSEVNKRLAAQEKLLNSYGPTADKGFVHIPIQQAIRAVAGQLPVRKQRGETTKDNGLIDSGESNSGRMFWEGPR
jgi:hypothetical protein